VVLSADNTFTGGVTLTKGTLDLTADGAGGDPASVWDESGGTLSVAAGDGMTFTGTGNVFSGTLAGAGTIDFDGGSDTLSGTDLSAPSGVFISGATVALVGTISLTDTLVATTPKIVIGAAGATLAGGGRLELTDAATNLVLGVSATTTLTNDDVIFGAGDLGDGQMTLDNAAKGIIEGDDSIALTINTGTKSILNAGDIVAVTALTIDSGVDNIGELLADGGTLTVQEAVTGAGHAEVEGAGTLILKSAFNENVTFASGSTGTLELGDSKGYTTGAVTGFSKTGANALDLLDIPFVSGTTTATYSGTTTSGVLTVKDGANVATIHLTGNYTTSTFTVSSSSAGGTKVVDPAQPSAPPHVAAPLSPHPFIAAMAGFGAREAGAAALDGVRWSMPPLVLAPSRALA
jgi:autotransporter-associated beta strand protein